MMADNPMPAPSAPPDAQGTSAPQLSQADAAQQLADIRGGSDPQLVKDFVNGKAYAAARLDALQRAALNVKPSPPEQSLSISSLVPPETVTKFLAGDPVAAAEIDRIQREQIAARTAQTAPTAGLDGMTDEERAHHDAVFQPPPSPADYQLYVGQTMTEDDQQDLGNARTWLHTAGVPKAEGEYLLESALKDGRALVQMNAADRETYKASQVEKLQRLWGNDYDTRLAEAQAYGREVDAKVQAAWRRAHLGQPNAGEPPSLIDYLEDTGLGNNYAVVAQFAELARRKGGKR